MLAKLTKLLSEVHFRRLTLGHWTPPSINLRKLAFSAEFNAPWDNDFVFGLGAAPEPAGEARESGGHVRRELLVGLSPGRMGEIVHHGLIRNRERTFRKFIIRTMIMPHAHDALAASTASKVLEEVPCSMICPPS